MTMTTRRSLETQSRSRLTRGFESLTLDPSPYLRRARRELAKESPETLKEAWMSVGKAMIEAIAAIGQTLKADR